MLKNVTTYLKKWRFEKLYFTTWTKAYLKFFTIQHHLLLSLNMMGESKGAFHEFTDIYTIY
jgi:hypothetical protein